MNGSNQPSKLHLRHDVLHALEGFVGAGTVVQKQEDSRAHLDSKEKQRDSAKEIPVAQFVDRDGLVTQRGEERFPPETFVQPAAETSQQDYASRFRLTTTSSPRT